MSDFGASHEEWLLNESDFADMGDWDPKDNATVLVSNVMDIELQLVAIRALRLSMQRDRENEDATIEDLAKQATRTGNYFVIDQHVDHLHMHVYSESARCLANVGLLAPTVESLFKSIFRGIERSEARTDVHERQLRSGSNFWDCSLVFDKNKVRRDLTAGILQLAGAVGLVKYMPNNLESTLSALFSFRNKIFHNGMEWLVGEIEAFERAQKKNKWESDWFSKATSGGTTWVVYLTEKFFDHCLDTVDRVLAGVGAYCVDNDVQVAFADDKEA